MEKLVLLYKQKKLILARVYELLKTEGIIYS
jgi:hypothetical protein